jgi:hypothetical protein
MLKVDYLHEIVARRGTRTIRSSAATGEQGP